MLGQLVIAIRKAALMRGLELNEDQIEGYAMALRECNPDDVMAATINLWRAAETRSMPTPREITDQIRDRRRAATNYVIMVADGYSNHRWPSDAERAQIDQIVINERNATLCKKPGNLELGGLS